MFNNNSSGALTRVANGAQEAGQDQMKRCQLVCILFERGILHLAAAVIAVLRGQLGLTPIGPWPEWQVYRAQKSSGALSAQQAI